MQPVTYWLGCASHSICFDKPSESCSRRRSVGTVERLQDSADLSPVQNWTSILLGCYAGGTVFGSPICGWLADRSTSRRLPLVLGLLALGGSTILLCIGSSIGILVLGRVLEGVSGAVIWTSGPALLVDTVGQREIGQVMGYCALCINAAIFLGPSLGGIVFKKQGYHGVFGMAFGLICVDIVLRGVLIEKRVAAQWTQASRRDNDYWTWTYNDVGTPSIAPSPRMRALSPFGRLELTNFDRREINHEDAFVGQTALPRFPPVIILLRSQRVLVVLWSSFVQSAIMCAFDSVLPLFVQRTFGWNSIGAGLIFLALVIPSFLAPLVGWLADKYGSRRWLVGIGFAISLPFLVLLRLVTYHSLKQIVFLCTLLALLGTSNQLIMVPLMAEITHIVEEKERKVPGIFGKHGAYAQAYGLFFCCYSGGALVGPIWAGFVEQRAGWGTMAWSFGLLSGLTAILVLISFGGLITRVNTLERARSE